MQQASRRRSSLQEDAAEAPPQLPLTDGRHFACRRCRRILSETQWYATGCVECSSTMGVPDRDSLLDFATPHFHNFIGLIAPGQSWVARLIMKSRAPTNGVFAEKLSDDEVEEEEEEERDDVLAARDGEDHYDDDDDAENGEKDADVMEVAETPAAAAAAGGVAPSHDDDGDDDLEGILPAPKAPSSSDMAAAEAAKQPAESAVSAEDNAMAPADEARELKRVKLEVDHNAMRDDGSA